MTETKRIPAKPADVLVVPIDGGKKFRPSPSEDVFFKITGDETGGLVDYFEIRVGHLDGPPLHIHSVQDETFHILQGSLTLKVGDEMITAYPGDFLFIPKGVIHTYVNLHEELARAVGTLSPGGFDKFVEELSLYQASVKGRPDPQRVAEISAKHHQVNVGPPLAIIMGLRTQHETYH